MQMKRERRLSGHLYTALLYTIQYRRISGRYWVPTKQMQCNCSPSYSSLNPEQDGRKHIEMVWVYVLSAWLGWTRRRDDGRVHVPMHLLHWHNGVVAPPVCTQVTRRCRRGGGTGYKREALELSTTRILLIYSLGMSVCIIRIERLLRPNDWRFIPTIPRCNYVAFLEDIIKAVEDLVTIWAH